MQRVFTGGFNTRFLSTAPNTHVIRKKGRKRVKLDPGCWLGSLFLPGFIGQQVLSPGLVLEGIRTVHPLLVIVGLGFP
jgi:hypothetical protein